MPTEEKLDAQTLPQALRALGELLESRGLRFEVVAIGGSALVLLGLIDRATRDLDALALVEGDRLVATRELPPDLAASVADVGRFLGLDEKWLNLGPSSLLDLGVPAGFRERLVTQRYGGLTLHLASRVDHIAFKLYAAVDQGPTSKHAADLRELDPTPAELREAAAWARSQDPSEGFASELRKALRHFGAETDGAS